MKRIISLFLLLIYVNTFGTGLTDINLLVDGDSMMTMPSGTTNAPYYLDNNYFICTHTVTNVAVYGQTLVQMLSNFQTHLDAVYNAGYVNNICVILCGVNDLSSSADIDSVVNRQIRASKMANTKGFKVYYCTMRYYDFSPQTAEKCVTLDLYAQRMKDSATVGNYTIIDLKEDTHWNNCSTFYDLPHTYYYDYIHPSAAASDIFAQIIYNKLQEDAPYYILKSKSGKYYKSKTDNKFLKRN